MLELHSDELRGHHTISGVETKAKLAKFKHHVFFNTTLGLYPRIYLPNNLHWIVSKMVGENLLKFEHTRRHVIPKKHPLCTSQASNSMTLQQISLCPLVWLRATCCSGKILLRRQDFQKNFWNKQKVINYLSPQHHILPQHVTASCDQAFHYLLHLSTEKWGILKFSFDVV